MAKLITVPTFIFQQGDMWDQEGDSEKPIHVDYYNGSICLRQDGEYEKQEEIIISPKYLNALFKEIKKHLPEAEAMLNSKP
jgi:hypothetical protein